MNKQIIKICLAFSFMLLSSGLLNAQPGFDDDVTDTPIDGGISLLVGAGAAYGAKKFYNLKKNNPKNVE